MSEAAPGSAQVTGPGGEAQGSSQAAINLTPQQMEQLTDLVYRLIKKEALVTRERKGEAFQQRWR
jgi:hypothetical protein